MVQILSKLSRKKQARLKELEKIEPGLIKLAEDKNNLYKNTITRLDLCAKLGLWELARLRKKARRMKLPKPIIEGPSKFYN